MYILFIIIIFIIALCISVPFLNIYMVKYILQSKIPITREYILKSDDDISDFLNNL